VRDLCSYIHKQFIYTMQPSVYFTAFQQPRTNGSVKLNTSEKICCVV